jgi:hypothetical protein
VKAINRRIRRLEERLAPREDLESCRLADVLYERRRRRAEATGEPFDDPPPERRIRGPRISIAETLRLGRRRTYERNRCALGASAGYRYHEITPLFPESRVIRPELVNFPEPDL